MTGYGCNCAYVFAEDAVLANKPVHATYRTSEPGGCCFVRLCTSNIVAHSLVCKISHQEAYICQAQDIVLIVTILLFSLNMVCKMVGGLL